MKAFRRKGERYVARLDETEREIVAQLALDVAELLGATPAQLTDALAAFEAAVATNPHERRGSPGDPWELPPLGGLEAALDALGPTAQDPTEPLDPALRRLLPTASDDAEVAAEFRRFTQVDLRGLKIARLLALVRALGHGAAKDKLSVPRHAADLLAGALVDVRLVLAERLGVEDDESADALYDELARAQSGDTPESHGEALRLHLAAAYAALTWLQESLITAQLADLDATDA